MTGTDPQTRISKIMKTANTIANDLSAEKNMHQQNIAEQMHTQDNYSLGI